MWWDLKKAVHKPVLQTSMNRSNVVQRTGLKYVHNDVTHNVIQKNYYIKLSQLKVVLEAVGSWVGLSFAQTAYELLLSLS